MPGDITASNIGEFIRSNSCERRFKLDVNDRAKAKEVPFAERLFNSLDPVLRAQGRRREDDWEDSLRLAGLADLTRYDRKAKLHDPKAKTETPLGEFLRALSEVPDGEDAYGREIQLNSTVGAHEITARADFILLQWHEGNPKLLVVECKASRKDRTYHRIQLALYQVILRQEAAAGRIVVGQHRLGEDDILAIVARIDESTNGIQDILQLGYLDLSIERNDLQQLLEANGQLQRILDTDLDELDYTIEAKCDSCVFSVHCLPESALHRRLHLLGLRPSLLRVLSTHDIATIDDLADLDLGSDVALALRRDTECTESPERLQTFASARRRNLPGGGGNGEYPVQALPRSGFGQRPRHEVEGQRLTRVYLSVDYDYTENRVAALSAHVTDSDKPIYTGFVKVDEKWKVDPNVVERIKGDNGPDGKPTYSAQAVQGENIVEVIPAEWSQRFDPDTYAERQLLLGFFQKLTAAIARHAADGQVRLHFYVWTRSEMRRLMEACARVGSGLLSSMRELLGCREDLEQLIFSCLQDEVDQRYALGWTGRGLTVVSSLPWFGNVYHWTRTIAGNEVKLDTIFEQDIFDFKSTLAVKDGAWTERGDGTALPFEIRSRFNDSLPAPYLRAYWRTLKPTSDMDNRTRAAVERYNRSASPGLLDEYLKARVHALRWMDEAMGSGNLAITKAAMLVNDLPTFDLGRNSVAQSGIDFLRLDFHVGVQEWISNHLPLPADRISSGRTLPLCRVMNLGKMRLTAEIDANRYGTTLESLRYASTFADESFVRVTECPTDINTGQNVGDLLYRGVTARIELINWEAGTVELGVIPAGRNRSRYVFPSMLDDVEEPEELWAHATLDESLSDYVSGSVDSRLSAEAVNPILAWLDPTNPAIPERTAIAKDHYDRWDAALQALNLAPRNDRLNGEQRNAILDGLNTRVQLLQGPPGTGKTTVTSVTTLVKAYEFCQPGDVILIAAHTHTAVDTVLLRLQRDVAAFEANAREHGVPVVPVQLAKCFSSATNPLHAEIESLSPKHALITRLKRLRANSVVIAAGTTNAVLKCVDKINESREFATSSFRTKVLVIDEASQMVAPHFLALGTILSAEGQMFLAGDHNQLPPIVSHEWDQEDRPPTVRYQPFASAYTAIAEIKSRGTLSDASVRVDRLQYSYRLPWVVMDLLNRLYARDNVTLDGPDGTAGEEVPHDGDPVSYIWAQPKGLFLVVHDERRSKERNDLEISLIQRILDAAPELPHASVAILTPHRSQSALLKQQFAGQPYLKMTSTIDSIQGDECKNILVSGTVSDPSAIAAAPEFYLSLNRSNVAFSRTQERLIVVCSASLLDYIPPETEDYQHAILWKALRRICTHEVGSFQHDGHDVTVTTHPPDATPET